MDAGYRVVKAGRVATGKITTGRSIGRGKQRVADKNGIFDQVADAVGGVPGRFDYPDGQRADFERVSLGQQAVELAAIGRHARHVEHSGKRLLHLTDSVTTGNAGPAALPDQVRRRQVIGMGMRFQHPVDAAVHVFGGLQHRIDEGGVGQSADRIIYPYRVDNSGDLALNVC